MFLTSSHAQLLISAAHASQFPEFQGCEIVMVGKSNVGKSSLINALTNRKRLAYVGGRPGKTRLINFYQIREDLMLVDVPGYGFANRSKQEQEHYGTLMDAYFELRTIQMMLLLIDVRRGLAAEDEMMIEFAKHHLIPYAVILTKVDKVARNATTTLINQYKERLGVEVFPFSAQKHETRQPIQDYLERIYTSV